MGGRKTSVLLVCFLSIIAGSLAGNTGDENVCAGPRKISFFRLFLDSTHVTKFLFTVKQTADAVGFMILSLATFYIAYKNITYKGPRS